MAKIAETSLHCAAGFAPSEDACFCSADMGLSSEERLCFRSEYLLYHFVGLERGLNKSLRAEASEAITLPL